MDANTIQKHKNKSLPKLLKKAQEIFNKFIRLRDSDSQGNFKCISCGNFKSKRQSQCGHFYSQGNNTSVRFDEDNCHAQCIYCNKHMHGNLIPYGKNLIKKIGEDRFNGLVMKMKIGKRGHKIDRFTIIEIIETYKVKVKELEKTKMFKV